MFLNNFHREHILLKLKIKKLLRKIKSKNLTAGVKSGGKYCEKHEPRSDCPIRCTLIKAHIPCPHDKASMVGNIVNNMSQDQTAPLGAL